MKFKCIVFLIVILSFTISLAQQIKIKVNNFVGDKATLSLLSGENIITLDTVTSTNKSEFHFSLGSNHSGIYRLSLTNNMWIDFIYDNEIVDIETDANNIFDSLKVIKSESNKIYYGFIKLNKDYKTKTELLQLILARYPKEEDYYQITKEKLIQVQKEYLYFVNVTSQSNPNSFIARYLRLSQLPVVETEIPFDKHLAYLKTHALDNVNFYDDELIYSDAFTNKTIEF